MIQKHIKIALVILFSVMPLDAFAQESIMISPEAVAGLTCSSSTTSTFFKTQSISALAGVEGSIRGLTDDSNLALNLGVGYESRGVAGRGSVIQVPGSSPNVMRENYVDLDASFRHKWLQLGVVVGLPLNWSLTINNAFPTTEWNFSNANMAKTVGIFAAGNFTISEWSSGKLIFIARLDFDIQPGTNQGVVLEASPPTYQGFRYFPISWPFFLARVGLSYEFTVWRGTQ